MPGDWFCSSCQHCNFARNQSCRKCGQPKEQSIANGGQVISGSTTPDDAIDVAAGTALLPIAHLETTWDHDKLRWNVAKYFRRAAKEMEFTAGKPWEDLIHQYATEAFGTMIHALGDRPWVNQADYTLILDTAVKELFPKDILAAIPLHELEGSVLKAHDSAFEEARVSPVLWEAVQGGVDGKKGATKVYNAMEIARREALKTVCPIAGDLSEDALALEALTSAEKMQKFIQTWISVSCVEMKKITKWDPADLLSAEQMANLVQVLIQADTLPASLLRNMAAEGASVPVPYPGVDEMCQQSFAENAPAPVYKQPKPAKPFRKKYDPTMDPAYKTELCWYFQNGDCVFGDQCSSAHGEHELRQPGEPFQPPWQGGGALGPGGKSCGKGKGKGGGKDLWAVAAMLSEMWGDDGFDGDDFEGGFGAKGGGKGKSKGGPYGKGKGKW